MALIRMVPALHAHGALFPFITRTPTDPCQIYCAIIAFLLMKPLNGKTGGTVENTVIKQYHWPEELPSARASKKRRSSTARRAWTKEEDAIIRKNYTKHGSRYTAELLGRNHTSVQHRAIRLGVPGCGQRPWTRKEEYYLRKFYGKLSATELARILQRTEQSVRAHIHQLGLGNYQPQSWTDGEVQYLMKHYGNVSVADLAEELGRTTDAVELKAGKLGLRKKVRKLSEAEINWVVDNLGVLSYEKMAHQLGVSNGRILRIATKYGHRPRPNNRLWTDEEDAYLRKHYGKMTRKELAEALDRTIPLVSWRARKLGLTVGRRTVDKPRSWTAQEDTYVRENFDQMTYEAIAEELDRTSAAVASRIVRLGLRQEEMEGVAE